MIAPMRSVMAETVSHCDMDDTPVMSSTTSHQMHLSQADIDEPQQMKTEHSCCCCDVDSCASNCDMGMTTSMLMQGSMYSPVFVVVAYIELFSSEILARALTPPTRPPLKLS